MPLTPNLTAALHGKIWSRWCMVVLTLAVLLGGIRWQTWQQVGIDQRERLSTQIESISQNLERQLEGVNSALIQLQSSALQGGRLVPPAEASLRLLSDAMPGVRTLLVLDAEGRAIASNRPELVGQDFSQRTYFQRARREPQPEVLAVSPPFRSVLGVFSVNLSRTVVDEQGRFVGIVGATLDPTYFRTVLRSGIYADDMWAGVAQGEGRPVLYEPPRTVSEDTLLLQPGTLFEQHLRSGQPTTVLQGTLVNFGDERLLAQHTVQPPALAMDHPLVLGLSRDVDAMYQPWRETTLAYLVGFLLLAAGSAAALWLMQRRHAERLAERMRNEQALSVTLHSIGDAVIAADPQGRITRLNPTAERLTGWSAAVALGRPLGEVLRVSFGGSDEALSSRLRQALSRGERIGLSGGVELIARDGRRIPIAESTAPIRGDDGTDLGVVVVFSDITEERRARLALEDRERQLSAITDALPGPVSRVDRDGRYLFANAAYERWFGLPPSAVIGRTQREVLGAHYGTIADHVTRAMAGETVQYETRVPAHAGTLHALVTLVPDRDAAGDVRGHFTVVTDITERHRAEEALQVEESRARALLQALDAGVVVHGPDAHILTCNESACRILGLSREQMAGKGPIDPAWNFVAEDGAPLPHEQFPVLQVLSTGAAIQGMILGVRRPDRADVTWIIVSAQPQRNAGGQIDAVVVTFVDVTERVQAQQQLRLLQAAVERLNDIVLITEPDPGDPRGRQRIVYANPAFERVTGYQVAEAMGRSPSFLQGPDTDPAAVDRIRQAVRAQQPIRTELLNYRRDGQPYWIELDVVTLSGRSGRVTHMVAVQRDITERRAAEAQREALQAQLRASQKLEAVGTLASGIAHDFNNIVAGILGNVALAKEDLEPGHPALTSVQQIERAGVRARDLVRQILAFGRRSPLQRTQVDLRDVMDESLALTRTGLPPGTTLKIQRPGTQVWVQGDATQLQQVLINLCVNAQQALPESGGEIRVGLETIDGQARLWVSDTGSGMDESVRQRIFDPFFTTKGPGKGTGLGLAVVHGIVLAHQGRIAVHSAPGQGSTFEVLLPLDHRAGQASPTPPSAPQERPGQGELLLVVDDDHTLRDVLPRLLQRAGWRTETFAGAREALERLASQGEPPALLLTDLNMPDVSGLELCRSVAAEHPTIARLLISGHTTDALRQRAVELGVKAVLAKEDLLETLVPAVASALGTRPAAKNP
jgi:PAS domain S-box-containing protein